MTDLFLYIQSILTSLNIKVSLAQGLSWGWVTAILILVVLYIIGRLKNTPAPPTEPTDYSI